MMTNKILILKLKEAIIPSEYYQAMLPTMPPPRKQSGWVCGGRCPFHKDERTGSFFVNLDFGGFKCHSCKVAGGDVIAFMRELNNLTFFDAVRHLCEWAGVPYDDSSDF